MRPHDAAQKVPWAQLVEELTPAHKAAVGVYSLDWGDREDREGAQLSPRRDPPHGGRARVFLDMAFCHLRKQKRPHGCSKGPLCP